MNIDLNNIKKVLIIRLSSLGDILLTTPLVRSLKNQLPSLEIDFLLRKEYQDVYKYNSQISNLYVFENNFSGNSIELLKSRNYDLIIDLQNNIRSKRIINKLNIPALKFHKRTFDKILLVEFKINRMKNLPQIPVRYAEVIPNFMLDNAGLELFLPDNIYHKINGNNTIGFCPGSRHFTKQWPVDYFIELGKLLAGTGYKIVLFGGKDDRDLCKQISSSIPKALDLSNDNLLLQTATDMKSCKSIICNDSGLMHLACAVNVPVILIMGSTVKEFGFKPYLNRNLIFENNLLSCRPCSHIGRKNCPKKHFKCMLELNPNHMIDKMKKFLQDL
jgi:lipopolysaccharide heptosyltransferase II